MFLFRSDDSCFIDKLFNVYQSFLPLGLQNGSILCYVQHFVCDQLVCYVYRHFTLIILNNLRSGTYTTLIYL